MPSASTAVSTDLPAKPRILIADDSRIVRATLIKHIEGIFEYREASDGLEAWETLLIDPNIQIVLSDLTMPRLDGYGLLARIRASKIARIRSLPVVIVSGSQDQPEQDRARAAGATDLIGKGMQPDALLFRLNILTRLISTQAAFERGLEARVKQVYGSERIDLSSPAMMGEKAAAMLEQARAKSQNFVLLTIRIGLQHVALSAYRAPSPEAVVDAVGQLLARTVRQSDCVALTDAGEFTLATTSVRFSGVREFAERVCAAIANAHLIEDVHMLFVASGGLVALDDIQVRAEDGTLPDLATMRRIASRRALLGFNQARSGVIGAEEEKRSLP
ncbi:MAG: response regulator [Herminiimonas sp.]|nr:response regulator [Herminiimonas sp.]